MSSSRMKVKKEDPMQKRIPRNPKYKRVEAVVDSGSSMTKYLKKIEDIRTNYRYRPDELFKRMKVSTFVQLIIQVSSVDGDAFFDSASEAGDTMRPDTVQSDITLLRDDGAPGTARSEIDGQTSRIDTARSTLHGLITGVGEFDLQDGLSENGSAPNPSSIAELNAQPDQNLQSERPFLILDVRDRDEFQQCHIISAESFPIALLSRSCNYESKSMLVYKNQPGKIIVLYDEDERMAPKAATTLCERGYDNLFVLSGGLKVCHKLFPEGMITGTIPQHDAEGKVIDRGPATETQFTRCHIFALLDAIDVSASSTTSSRMSSRISTRQGGGQSTTKSQIGHVGQAIHRKPFK